MLRSLPVALVGLHHNRNARRRVGFTLFELAIVLLIIGLLTGAVLFGGDLIAAAAIRQQISQIDQFKVAVSSFRTKYGGLPGDLQAAAASGFGMSHRTGQPGDGDGNGAIGACVDGASVDYFGCETVLFWTDLSFAGFISDAFNMPSTGAWITVNPEDLYQYLPSTMLNRSASITAFTLNSTVLPLSNLPICTKSFCFSLVQIVLIHSTNGMMTGGWSGAHLGLHPAQAFAIDAKMDDGRPFTGHVAGGFSYGTVVITDPAFYANPNNDLCLSMAGTGASPDDFSYTATGPYANLSECSMNILGL